MSSKCLVCMRWFIAGDIKVINDSGATIHQKCEQRKLPKIVQTEGCTLENVERWMCYKCTFAHNHPLSHTVIHVYRFVIPKMKLHYVA